MSRIESKNELIAIEKLKMLAVWKMDRLVIANDSTLYYFISLLRLSATYYYSVAVPINVAFTSSKTPPHDILLSFVLGWSIDLILYADIITKFFVSYR